MTWCSLCLAVRGSVGCCQFKAAKCTCKSGPAMGWLHLPGCPVLAAAGIATDEPNPNAAKEPGR